MRYLIFYLVFVTLCLVGCRTYSATMTTYQSCLADPACVAEMQLHGNAARVAATQASSSTGLSDVIGWLVGTVVSFAVGVLHGKRKGGVK